jgi:hypothetical protein
MPTGTYVHTTLRSFPGVKTHKDINVMEVDIFPSRVDVGNSSGLCSRLGSNKTLIKRDGTKEPHSHNPDRFSLSWR